MLKLQPVLLQVAGDANALGQVYPDQSLYPANSVPIHVKRLNQALQRADQIEHSEGKVNYDWCAPWLCMLSSISGTVCGPPCTSCRSLTFSSPDRAFQPESCVVSPQMAQDKIFQGQVNYD